MAACLNPLTGCYGSKAAIGVNVEYERQLARVATELRAWPWRAQAAGPPNGFKKPFEFCFGLGEVKKVVNDIELVKSKVNRQDTLDERKAQLRGKRDGAKQALTAKSAQTAELIQKTMDQMLLQYQPTRILVEVDNGRIVGAAKLSRE